MEQENMDNLGFTEENTAKTEEDRKKALAEKFLKMNEDARKTVEARFKDAYKNQSEEFVDKNNDNKNKNI